jgi:hypothetical protein
MHLLALTTAQLNFVMAAAKAMPVEWRSRYLAAIADEPLALPGDRGRRVARAVERSAWPWVELQHDRGVSFLFPRHPGAEPRGRCVRIFYPKVTQTRFCDRRTTVF